MANVIAEIRLAPGEVGYYDDYSRIYLNAARPMAKIYSDMNTTQIRKSIRSGRLILISGSLSTSVPVKKEKEKEKPAISVEKKKPVENKPEPVINEEPVKEPVEEPVTEIIPTEPEPVVIPEEPVEEKPEPVVKPKRRSRKKQAAEAE